MILKKSSRRRSSGKESPRRLNMVARGFYCPKKNPKKPLGDDACFICERERTMGVADGVGSWASRGIDAGVYARELMRRAVIAVKHEPKRSVNVRRVLDQAFLLTKAKGSSTASIVTIKEDVLHGVNVGDSGLMLFRNNKLLFRSPIQQHRFNTPYQLGNSKGCDRPKSGVEYEVKVQPGDIVVLGTDGLWDNVFPHEMEHILMEKNDVDVQDLAGHIANVALRFSIDEETVCPFGVAARKEGWERSEGGKVDDITVLVARITE